METIVNSTIVKRLSKYTSDQLVKKFESQNFTEEEKQPIIDILTKRGKLISETKLEVKEESKPINQKASEINKKFFEETKPVVKSKPSKLYPEIKVEDLTVEQIIDEVYHLNNKELNKELCSIFPEEGVEDYSKMDEDVVNRVRIFYNNILGIKPPKTSLPKAEKVKKEYVLPVELEGKKRGDIISIPSEYGILIGNLVSFTAFRTKEKVEGTVKRYFYDKQDQSYYFLIKGVNGKEYCKKPESVKKVK